MEPKKHGQTKLKKKKKGIFINRNLKIWLPNDTYIKIIHIFNQSVQNSLAELLSLEKPGIILLCLHLYLYLHNYKSLDSLIDFNRCGWDGVNSIHSGPLVLCFGFVTKTLLVTPSCFGYCGAVLLRHPTFLFFLLCLPQQAGLWVHKKNGGDRADTAGRN